MVRTNEGQDHLATLLTSSVSGTLFSDGNPESPTAGVGVTEDTQLPTSSDTFMPGYIGSASTLGSTLLPGGGGSSAVVSHTNGTASVVIQTPVVTSDQSVTLAKIGLYGEDERTANVEPASSLWYEGMLNRRLAVTSGDKTQVTFLLSY